MTSSQFCVFCYKIFDYSVNNAAICNIKKFTQLLYRFVNLQNKEPTKVLNELCAIDKLAINCCNSCQKTVNKFCDIYHQLKLLELQLDLKLNKLVERIDHANKVPTRWISLNKLLEEVFQNGKEEQVGCQNKIRSFRQNVLKAGRRRKVKAQPRVLLTDHDRKTRKTAQFSEDQISDVENGDFDYLSDKDSIIGPSNRYKNCDIDTRNIRRQFKDKICPKCGKQLKSFRGLYVHLEHHKQQRDWKWECGECQKKFATKSNLTSHLKTHAGEKPFVCRFCGRNYRYKYGLQRHLLYNHYNEEGVREEISTPYHRDKKGDLGERGNGTKNYFQRCKQKYLIRKKGATKVVYYQNRKCGLDKENSKLVKRNKLPKITESEPRILGSVDVVVGIETETGFSAYVSDSNTDKKVQVDKRDSSAADVFKDPHIQIKLENEEVSGEFQESIENSSMSNGIQNSKYFEETDDTSQTNGNKPTTIDATETETSTSIQQNSRYSLREKRARTFTDFEESDTDNYENNDTEFNREKFKLKESSESDQEDQIVYRHGSKQVRKRKQMKRGPLNFKINPKPLTVKCEICSRQFVSFLKKDYHFKIQHDLNKNTHGRIFKCERDSCEAYFLSSQQLYFHHDREHNIMRKKRDGTSWGVDKKRFICKLCGKGFPGNLSLTTHLEYHKDPSEWKWECGICGKKSATEYKLKDHMRTHTDERPYSCRFCKERFRSDYKYKEHLNLRHSDEEEIRMELESKRVNVVSSKVNDKSKAVLEKKKKNVGGKIKSKVKSKIGRNKVEVKKRKIDEESERVEIKKEFVIDGVFREDEEIEGNAEDFEDLQDQVGENISDEGTEGREETGSEENGASEKEVVIETNGINFGGVNIFQKGKYFGDGTLAEIEDLE